jgi:hypothetical protein
MAAQTGSNASSNSTVEFTWRRGRLFDRLSCLVLYEACVEQGTGHVASTTEKPTRKFRPVPLSTIELQTRMNRYDVFLFGSIASTFLPFGLSRAVFVHVWRTRTVNQLAPCLSVSRVAYSGAEVN